MVLAWGKMRCNTGAVTVGICVCLTAATFLQTVFVFNTRRRSSLRYKYTGQIRDDDKMGLDQHHEGSHTLDWAKSWRLKVLRALVEQNGVDLESAAIAALKNAPSKADMAVAGLGYLSNDNGIWATTTKVGQAKNGFGGKEVESYSSFAGQGA